MASRSLLRTVPLVVCLLLAGCGDDDADPSATVAAPVSEPVGVGSPDASAPGDAAVGTAPQPGSDAASADIGDLVCTALTEILADNEVSAFSPDAAVAQFGLKTLGADPTAAQDIAAGADAAAVEQCPDDRTAVLEIAQRDSLGLMITNG